MSEVTEWQLKLVKVVAENDYLRAEVERMDTLANNWQRQYELVEADRDSVHIESKALRARIDLLERVAEAARMLYDNRLGWSDGRNPYAPPKFWDDLRDALGQLDAPASEGGKDGR